MDRERSARDLTARAGALDLTPRASGLALVDAEKAWWELLARQFGVGRVGQAKALGVTPSKLKWWVKKGRLKSICNGVVAASGAPETYRRRLMLGVLLGSSRAVDVGVRAAIYGLTAAIQLDLIERPEKDHPIEILSQRRIERRRGYRFVWTSRLPKDEIVVVRGIPTTDAPRTFIDLCHEVPHRAVWAYRRGLRKGLFTPESIRRRLDIESRQGRSGITTARRIVEEASPTAQFAKSALEDRFFEHLVAAGYPPPARNHKEPGSFGFDWEIDLYWPAIKKGFEISPYETHGSLEAHERDGRKTLDLAAKGIYVYPVTYEMSRAEFLRFARGIIGAPSQFPARKKAVERP
ncbi:MAG: type IV toxin-antitoxin system AbiEi family antitoxin domain-containing protein [Actinomycetota bacterium]